MHKFHVVAGEIIDELLRGHELDVVDWVRTAYLAHDLGDSINPDSYFLRFPDKPEARIIALPAYLGGAVGCAGLKWISSFPLNLLSELPRASGVLILNDYQTGYPYALLEAAAISAARTAGSAALATRILGATAPQTIGIVGCGVISWNICRYLQSTGTTLKTVVCYDRTSTSATMFSERLDQSLGVLAAPADLNEALNCDLVIFATTAPAPYVSPAYRFHPGQIVLNVSLRDLSPETLLSCDNVVDDVEHCLKAGTSPHLAEKLTGNRDFITGTLAEFITGQRVGTGRPIIFSPFGLGVLDLAVGRYLYLRAVEQGMAIEIPGFFGGPR